MTNSIIAYEQNTDYQHLTSRPTTPTTELQLRIIEGIQDNYTYQIRHFCAFIRSEGLDVNYEAIRAYFETLNEGTYSANTVRIKRAAVLSRIRLLFRDQPTDERVKLELSLKDLNIGSTRSPKVNNNAITSDRIISPLEYERLLTGARSERQRLFMMTLWVSGMRISELTSITLSNCEQVGDRVKIRIMGKGKKERFIYLPTVLYERIQKEFDGSTLLFATKTGKEYSRSYISAQIAKLGKHILNRRISAHTFRHSFATRKIKETAKIQAVSQYLGHSSVAITLSLYCHESLSAEDLSSETDMIGIMAA